MATTAQESEGFSPLAVFVLFLALAMAIGGLKDLDLSKPKSGAATSTPCPPDEDPSKPVRTFFASRLGQVQLRCGGRKSGWKHIQRRHGPVNSRTYTCIKRVLTKATPMRETTEWLYQLNFRGGDYAIVRVNPRSKTINSAYTKGDGKASARWRDCITRRIR